MEDITKVFVEHLAPVLAVFVATALTTLAGVALRKLNQILGLKRDEARERVISDIVIAAVAFAEQSARKWARSRSVEGHEKLDAALGYALAEARRRGLLDIGRDEFARLIESWLGAVTPRADRVGVR